MSNENEVYNREVYTRISQKHDLEVNWDEVKEQFVPLDGEIIIFDKEVDANGTTLTLPEGRTKPYKYDRFKIGDGKSTLSKLEFCHTGPIDDLFNDLFNDWFTSGEDDLEEGNKKLDKGKFYFVYE